MPNLGPTELLIILGIVVLIFGGRKLPEFGRALREFKNEVSGDEKDEVSGDDKRSLETREANDKPDQG